MPSRGAALRRAFSGGAVPLLALLWGLNWPVIKTLLAEVAPWTLRATGMGAGALLLMAVSRWRGRSLRVAPRQWLRLLVAAVLTVAGFNLLTAFAQQSGSTSRAAIVTYMMPVWTIVLARAVLGERLSPRRRVAVAFGMVGLALLAAPLAQAGALPRGVLFSLGAGMSWAAGTVFVKRYPIQADALTLVAWQLALGALVAGAGMLWFEGVPVPKALSLTASLALGYHVVLAVGLAYVVWFELVARVPAGVAALGTLMVPVVGVASAMLWLGERPSASDWGGAACILAAAALSLPRAADDSAPRARLLREWDSCTDEPTVGGPAEA